MVRYFKYSLLLHGLLFAMLAAWTFLAPERKHKNLQFVILPKGTSLNAVMTKEIVEAMNRPAPSGGVHPSPTPSPTPTPSAVASVTPSPTQTATQTQESARGTPDVLSATPASSPTPVLLTPTPTLSLTAAPTPTPAKTIAITPRATPSATPSPRATKSPTPRATSTKASAKSTAQISPTTRPQQKGSPTRSAAKQTPKPTPKEKGVASAYELASAAPGGNRFTGVDLPRQTPAGASVGEALAGQEIGVPGVPEGVEGAPLPLDRNQSILSMLYTTRARMKIQSNFTVPPGVNDPNLTCVVEWEILRDGTIQNIRVVKSTGVAQYDACAIDALRKTGNLGPLPPEFGKSSIWTSLTFVFAGENAEVTTGSPSQPPSR